MEERSRVLGMLAEGRISVEEADRLLVALEEKDLQEQRSVEEPRPRRVSGAASNDDGSRKLTFDQLVQLGIHGIDPTWVRRIRARFPELDFDRLVDFGIHGVDVDYLERINDVLPDLDPDEIVQMATHGVDADYVREVRERLPNRTLTVDEIVQLAIHGIDPELIDALADELSDIATEPTRTRVLRRPVAVRRPAPPLVPRPPLPPRPPGWAGIDDVPDLPDSSDA